MLDSPFADIRQCALDKEADHILAARFVGRFVKHEVPWVHLDLSVCNVKGGLAHIPTDNTGFGVRYTLTYRTERRLVERLACSDSD
jgi:leucyl aminopeptidase